ncbi:hypothetical protein F5Y12DRAFT_277824 [Xylaria sp. FL1777]|nr:hypothetical protein F5Y12DRAFT_277824 [Xylaria sp. FL1777]
MDAAGRIHGHNACSSSTLAKNRKCAYAVTEFGKGKEGGRERERVGETRRGKGEEGGSRRNRHLEQTSSFILYLIFHSSHPLFLFSGSEKILPFRFFPLYFVFVFLWLLLVSILYICIIGVPANSLPCSCVSPSENPEAFVHPWTRDIEMHEGERGATRIIKLGRNEHGKEGNVIVL